MPHFFNCNRLITSIEIQPIARIIFTFTHINKSDRHIITCLPLFYIRGKKESNLPLFFILPKLIYLALLSTLFYKFIYIF